MRWSRRVSVPPREPAAPPRHRWVKAAAQVAAIGAITAGTGFAVYAERSTLASGLRAFTHANIGWVAAGWLAESLSMTAFALLQRRLLLTAGARLTFGSLMAIVYASTAGVGAVVSGNPGASLAGLLTSVLAATAMCCLVLALHSARGRARLRRPAVLVLQLAQRLAHWPRDDTDTIVTSTLERLGGYSLALPSGMAACVYALVNWAADVLCLAAAIAAIGGPVPWDKLVLVWSAGQAAAGFSPTPYGIGLVDIALIFGLHAARLGTPDAVAAVLYYRIITFKIGATLLWMGCAWLRNRPARARRLRPAAR
jgi:putative heme transporter